MCSHREQKDYSSDLMIQNGKTCLQHVCETLFAQKFMLHNVYGKGVRAHSTFHLNAGMVFKLKDQPPLYRTLFVP